MAAIALAKLMANDFVEIFSIITGNGTDPPILSRILVIKASLSVFVFPPFLQRETTSITSCMLPWRTSLH